MTKTTIMPIEDVLHRLNCFIEQDNIGTIFPDNFFISIRHYIKKPFGKCPSCGAKDQWTVDGDLIKCTTCGLECKKPRRTQ